MITDDIRARARELLTSGAVGAVVGFAEGTSGSVRAYFARTPEQADALIYDDRCRQNLAHYFIKEEVRDLGTVAIVANLFVMRSLVVLMSEHQVTEASVVVLGVTEDKQLRVFTDARSLADYTAGIPFELREKYRDKLADIDAMTPEERWDYWIKELSECIKCYACRAACPMCYCTRCTVECNQPQWIHVPSHELGNLEWHMMRAMHLAGRCVSCGECHRACPLDLPIHLLTIKVQESVTANFGVRPGASLDEKNALAVFQPDDKENFIR